MIKLNDKEFEYKSFPNCELQIIVNDKSLTKDNRIVLDFNSETIHEDLQALLFLCSYINDRGNPFTLEFSYLPYSRMDREINSQVCTLKPFLEQFFNLKNCTLIVNCIHSTVNLPKDNLHRIILNKDVDYVLKSCFSDFSHKTLVFPDFGALNRYIIRDDTVLKLFPEGTKILFGSKIRNAETNEIDYYTLREYKITGESAHIQYPDINSMDFQHEAIIVDDMIDSGSTIFECTKALRTLGINDISVCVYHISDQMLKSSQDYGVKMFYGTDSMLNENQLNLFKSKPNFKIISHDYSL
jgi:ribose-phosphate pyrophosphokinase